MLRKQFLVWRLQLLNKYDFASPGSPSLFAQRMWFQEWVSRGNLWNFALQLIIDWFSGHQENGQFGATNQGCIFRLTCSHPELTEDHVLTSACVKSFRTVTRNAVNKSVWRKKRLFLTSLKQTCNEYLIKFSENQSAPKLENRKTSPCAPCAPNLLHVLVSRILGYHNLCGTSASQACALRMNVHLNWK